MRKARATMSAAIEAVNKLRDTVKGLTLATRQLYCIQKKHSKEKDPILLAIIKTNPFSYKQAEVIYKRLGSYDQVLKAMEWSAKANIDLYNMAEIIFQIREAE